MSVDEDGTDEAWAATKLQSPHALEAKPERRCWLVKIDRGEPYDEGDLKCVDVTRHYECDDGGTKTVVKTICYRRPGS